MEPIRKYAAAGQVNINVVGGLPLPGDSSKRLVPILKKSVNTSSPFPPNTPLVSILKKRPHPTEITINPKSFRVDGTDRPLVDYPLTQESSSSQEPGCSFWSDDRRGRSEGVLMDDVSNKSSDSSDSSDGEEVSTAFKSRVSTRRLPARREKDPITFLKKKLNALKKSILNAFKEHGALKINLRLHCEMIRGSNERVKTMFKTKNFIYMGGDDLMEELEKAFEKLLKELEEYLGKGSGWALSRILFLELCLNSYTPLKASSYIDLPPIIKKKEACLNIQNEDVKCFAWTCLAFLNPINNKKHPERVSHYRGLFHTLNFDGIDFPVAITDIPKFEKQNNLGVNVIGYDRHFFPLYVSKQQHDRTVDLLYITNDETSHYCLIKSMSRLLRSEVSKHGHEHFFCRNCLCHYQTTEKLERHQLYCLSNNTTFVSLPTNETNVLKFKDFFKTYKVPFIVYADFESVLIPTTNPDILHRHTASSYAYFIKNMYSQKEEVFRLYRGEEDVGGHFLDSICRDVTNIYNKRVNIPLTKLTPLQEQHFNKSNSCFLCDKLFTKTADKCRDHLNGEYRGAACKSCNLNYTIPNFIPIVFHNMSRYDLHLFVKALSNTNFPGDVRVLPHTEEDYISLSRYITINNKKIELRFIDSFRFLPSSLDNLVRTLSVNKFTNMTNFFPNQPLLLRKGVFPYEYLNEYTKYFETSLPPKDQFYSRLTDSHISDVDYEHALKVWDTYNISDLGAYSDLYLKCDVLLLADIFENFRAVCLSEYGLDPAHFFTAPGLSWAAMLKFTNVQLQLLQDHDQILFVERGIRGGISQISQRHATANNKYMADYDSTRPSEYLLYIDINNLYGWAMSQPLPYGNFKWLTPEEIQNFDISSVSDTDEIGYFLEVDIEYPPSLHNMHNSFPCAPHKELVKQEWVAPYLGEGFKPSNSKKLLTTLYNKTNYVVHAKTLQLFIRLGLRLTKVHRGLKFAQTPWLKPYIDHNTTLRQTATDDFGRDFYKLMNNAIFGKTMQNIRNHQDIALCNSWEQARKLITKPSFKSSTVFTESLIAVHRYKERIVFNKPIYVGMAILDISKTNVYNFHYNVMVSKYGLDVDCLYHDTDSFIYCIRTDDVYQDIQTDPTLVKHFDTSNFPTDNPYGLVPNPNNRLVLGLMKDENKGDIMVEFIGLRSKMYSTRVHKSGGDIITKKSKGVKKSVIKNKITFLDYKKCLNKKEPQFEDNICIRSVKHDLQTLRMQKKALCCLDDKKFILPDGIHCLSYGHHILLPPRPPHI